MSYSYTVTDSRGLARTYTGTLTVLAWRAPQIAGFAVERVTSGGDLAVEGTYARVTVQATASTLPVDGAQKNSLSYYVRYRQAGASRMDERRHGERERRDQRESELHAAKGWGQCRNIRRSDRLTTSSW